MHFFQCAGGRQAAVAGKGKHHARGGCHGGQSAQQLGDENRAIQKLFEGGGNYRVHRAKEDTGPQQRGLIHVRDGDDKRTQHDIPE